MFGGLNANEVVLELVDVVDVEVGRELIELVDVEFVEAEYEVVVEGTERLEVVEELAEILVDDVPDDGLDRGAKRKKNDRAATISSMAMTATAKDAIAPRS